MECKFNIQNFVVYKVQSRCALKMQASLNLPKFFANVSKILFHQTFLLPKFFTIWYVLFVVM